MADVQNRIKAGYHNYPKAKEGPNTGYENVPGSNPVLRGLPLAIAGSAYASTYLQKSLSNSSKASPISVSFQAFYGETPASARYENSTLTTTTSATIQPSSPSTTNRTPRL